MPVRMTNPIVPALLISAGLGVSAAPALAQPEVRLHSRLLIQEIATESGLREVREMLGSPSTSVSAGARVRFTLQFRLEDLDPNDPLGPVTGLGAMTFTITRTQGDASAGNSARSFLALGSGGVGVNEDATASNAGAYPSRGASTTRSGFHRWIRSGVQTDTSVGNGVFGSGTDIGTLVGIAGITNPGQDFSDPNRWYGVYSFEYQLDPNFTGDVTYAFRPAGSAGGPAGSLQYKYWRDGMSQPAGDASTVSYAAYASATLSVIPTPSVGMAALSAAGLCAGRRRRARMDA